ncbi:MAG: hypothetical protein HZA13_00930 [Nitrospirae bacterium]|nr:hypothetical protein [Nitrospirota bacterium]
MMKIRSADTDKKITQGLGREAVNPWGSKEAGLGMHQRLAIKHYGVLCIVKSG